MAFVPPPTRWQAEDASALWSPQQISSVSQSSTVPEAAEVDTVNNAWKHVKTVVVNDGKAADLYDLLSQSGKETIDPMPTGWPSLLKPKSSMMGKMPAMVMQRYSACQTVCFCGVFPEIRRAWASVDNSLFLWRYDRWNDVPIEYSNEEQAISAIGLIKPRAGVFSEAVQYLLVVCTMTEVVLLGMCFGAGNTTDPLNELSFVQLLGYSVSSDNVSMCSVAQGPDGRIFQGGNNGHLYEIVYQSSDTWKQKRCVKRDHSGGLASYLPTLIRWQKAAPILEIAVDKDRNILYTRSQTSIEVYDLGPDGKDASIRRVAEMSDFLNHATYASGGDIFRGRSPADRNGARIIHLGIIPPADSQKLHLVVVTQDGRRVYMTTTPSHGYSTAPPSNRPQTLKALIARQAPPLPASAAGGGTSSSKGLEANVALYCNCMLLLSEASQDGRSKLVVISRDMTVPPVATATTSGSSSLREAVGELEMLVPGEICLVDKVSSDQPLVMVGKLPLIDELAAQTVSPPPRFVLVSTAGVLELEKRRPVDILQQMLEERADNKVEQFFKSYGAAEVSAMCFLLVTSTTADASANVVQQAKNTLENANMTGIPQMRSDLGSESVPHNSGFDMGQAVPVAEPEWSGAHKGLCMYLGRLLQPVWEEPVVAPVQRDAALLSCRLPPTTLQAYEARLRTLESFVREYQQRRRSRGSESRALTMYGDTSNLGGRAQMDLGSGSSASTMAGPQSKRPRLEEAAKQEDQRVTWIRGLILRTAEACFLLRILSEHHIPRLASRLDETMRSRLAPLKLRDWVCSSEGEAVAASLISVLVTEHLTASGLAEELAATLQAGCPSYFKEEDKIFYQASGLLQRAESSSNTSTRADLANEALGLMLRVPMACDLGQVVPQLANLRNFAGCLELPLRKASALDPNNIATTSEPESRTFREIRFESCYTHVMQVVKFLVNPGLAEDAVGVGASMSAAERESAKKTLLQRCALAEDPYFHEVLYNTLVDLKAVKELLDLDTSYLEKHLRTNGGLPPPPINSAIGPLTGNQVYHLELLAKLYIRRENLESAAGVYEALASRVSGVGDQAITLEQRKELYEAAERQARMRGDPELIDRLEVRRRIMDLQRRLVEKLHAQAAGLQEGSAERHQLHDMAAELQEDPKELSQLYNDYAIPWRQWALALEMVALANFNDPVYIRQLWDVYLREAWDAKRAELASASTEAKARAAFEECCISVERMGAQSLSAAVFPAQHVCMRLELAAAGLWPDKGPASQEVARVPSAMLKAGAGREEVVMRVYDSLLAQRGGEKGSEELHLPVVRLRLLRSQITLLGPLIERVQESRQALSFGPLQGGARREVGILVEMCQKYASEAGRLHVADAQALAQQYSSMSTQLESLLQGKL